MERVVVVTGGGRGIGEEICRWFLRNGDEVIVLDVSAPAAGLPGVRYEEVDISHAAAVRQVFTRVPRVDVLINNAGIQRVGLVGEQPIQSWLEVIGVNLNGAYFCCDQAVKRMGDGGSIVFIASVAGMIGLPGRAAYSAAKAGLISLTRVLSVELAPRRIRVNAVSPGFTRTALVQQGLDDGSLELGRMVARVPLARLAEAGEIAEAVGFLSDERSSYITGQSLVVDGGWSVQGLHSPEDGHGDRLVGDA